MTTYTLPSNSLALVEDLSLLVELAEIIGETINAASERLRQAFRMTDYALMDLQFADVRTPELIAAARFEQVRSERINAITGFNDTSLDVAINRHRLNMLVNGATTQEVDDFMDKCGI